MDILCLLWCGHAPCADGPHWLIGQHYPTPVLNMSWREERKEGRGERKGRRGEGERGKEGEGREGEEGKERGGREGEGRRGEGKERGKERGGEGERGWDGVQE